MRPFPPMGELSLQGRSWLSPIILEPISCVQRGCTEGRGGNFVRTMMKLGTTYDEVSVVDDQIGNPTNAADLAHAMLEIALSDSFGIWHAACQGECTWADFAEAIMDEFGLGCRVLRCSTQQWLNTHPGTAQRPAFSSLDNAKLRYELRAEMRPWRDALKAFAVQCQKERECEKGIQ